MSEKPIEVGDLVVLVRGHSCTLLHCGGIPFKVTRIQTPTSEGWHCYACMRRGVAHGPAARYGEGYIPLSWLKRIPPPGELGLLEEKEPALEDAVIEYHQSLIAKYS